METSSKLRVDRICMTFQLNSRDGKGGNGAGALVALDDVSFDVRDREFVALIGPSGCGKSTLLKIIHGLLRADRGVVLVDGRQVTRPGFDRALVFQNAALLPWRTAQRNIELGLEAKGLPKEQRAEIA